MAKSLIFSILLLGLGGSAHAQVPGPVTIQQAMNQGLELEFSHFQEIADLVVVQGGATVDGDFLFLCSGRLMWKVSSAELIAFFQQEIAKEVERRGNSQELWAGLNAALSVRLNRIDQFQAGDTATLVRFRVRLEQAGSDWIVTESKIKESDRNPLSILDE